MQESTPAPFHETNLKSPWIFFQTGVSARAWTNLSGKIEEVTANINELVTKIRAMQGYAEEIPAHFHCFPTGVDLQVHLRFPGQAKKESLDGGLNSALVGGYDTVLTMPNTFPYLDDPKVLKTAITDCNAFLFKFSPSIKVLFTASATRGMQGTEAADILALVKAGAVAITDDGWGVKSDAAMEAIFEACAAAGVPFLQHAEIHGHKGVATASAFQRNEGLSEYPRSVESEMVKRDLQLLRKHKNARYHVLHISTRETIEAVRQAKEEGLNVTAEVTPHHLFFSNADIPPEKNPLSTNYKMNPPLFAPEDRQALREALRDGVIDFVSTDHAPHEADAKAQGWIRAPFGTRGMETALPVLVHLMGEKMLSYQRVVEVFSSEPRKFLGRKDTAEPTGIVFVDPHASWTVTEKDLPGISKNSCFIGAKLRGSIVLRVNTDTLYRRKD